MGDRKYYLKNREKVLAQVKLYNETHKAQRQKYLQDNKERIKLRSKQYHSQPVVKERKYQYNQTHKEERKLYPSLQKDFKSEYMREYRKNHIREHNKENREHYNRHKDKVHAKNKRWIKSHPKEWRKIVLKSQIKYLNKIGKSIGLEYHKLPYLYTQWSKTVREQYDNKCQVCFEPSVHSHHIFHKSKYPELSLNLNNGIPLCQIHHNEVHGKVN